MEQSTPQPSYVYYDHTIHTHGIYSVLWSCHRIVVGGLTDVTRGVAMGGVVLGDVNMVVVGDRAKHERTGICSGLLWCQRTAFDRRIGERAYKNRQYQ